MWPAPRVVLAILTVALALCVGCNGTGKPSTSGGPGGDTPPSINDKPLNDGDVATPSPRIDRPSLMAQQGAGDWDDDPLPDGVQVKLLLYQQTEGVISAVALRRGTVEFAMYDGTPKDSALDETEPLRTWRYTAAALRPLGRKTLVGTQYLIALDWGDKLPTQPAVKIVARLLKPGGAAIQATPVTVVVGGQ